LNLRFVKDKISEYKKIKVLLKEGLRKWIKANNLTSIYYVTQQEEKDEDLNEIIEVEYLNRNGNDYLNNLFSNLKKKIVLVPFPENQKYKKNSFVVPFNWVFANENIEYKKDYEIKEERNKLKLNVNFKDLSDSLIKFSKVIVMDEKEYNKKINYVYYIRKELNKNGINNHIYLNGSTYTNLGLNGSDIDIYIESNTEEETIPLLNKIGEIFKKQNMKDVNVYTKNKSRLCTFIDEKENLCVDISLNCNGLPKNLQLFKIYDEIDSRFKVLVLIIKYWVKQRGIDKGTVNERMINSYTYVLLLIYFLQIQQPPILPSSESLSEQVNRMNEIEKGQMEYTKKEKSTKETSITDKLALTSMTDMNLLSTSCNTKSVGELLVDFLEFYGFEFNYNEEVICPRKGYPLTKKEKEWEKCLVGIEDPIHTQLNKGNTLLSWCFEGIINEFKLAFIKLTKYKMDFIHEICQPLKEINFLPTFAFPPIDSKYKQKMLEDYVNTLK
jgi:DNA polymerase sigma